MGIELGGKDCLTSIYVVCEGSKSEPWFLYRFIEAAAKRFDLKYNATIYPTPSVDTENSEDNSSKSSSVRKSQRKTSGRQIQNQLDDPPMPLKETPKGGNPLYWVLHGKEKLKSFSEVFVVFDKDGHPKMKEAFDAANELDENGKKVTIILNSRSFEYYLLLHFERLYRSFEKTECGEKVSYGKKNKRSHTIYFNCSLPSAIAEKACSGDRCINGYARKNGYWTDSKDEHTFLSATNIWRGIENGEYVRNKAVLENQGTDVYELNPYVDFQTILARFLEMSVLRDGDVLSKDCGRGERKSIRRSGYSIIIENGSSAIPFILEEGWLEVFNYPMDIVRFSEFSKDFESREEAIREYCNVQFSRVLIRKERLLRINQQSSEAIDLPELKNDGVFAVLKFEGNSYLIF